MDWTIYLPPVLKQIWDNGGEILQSDVEKAIKVMREKHPQGQPSAALEPHVTYSNDF